MSIEHMRFHHIGVATKNINRELSNYIPLGYTPSSSVFVDERQKIKGVFITAQGQPCLELLENLTHDGPLTTYLQNGVRYYHFAYETDNIEADMEFLTKEKKAFVVVPITEATYFNRICFLMLPGMIMIELVEVKREI